MAAAFWSCRLFSEVTMKKLPYILYALLAIAVAALLVWDYMPDKTIAPQNLSRAGLLLLGLVLSVLKLSGRSNRRVSNKKALYTKAYSAYIQNVFAEDQKLEKLFFAAVDDYNQDKPAAGVAKLEKLRGSCFNNNDRYAVTVFMALCLDDMQLYDKAAEQYRAAVAIKPNSSLYSNLALTLERSGRDSEADAAYEQAIRIDPANAKAWNNMAQKQMRNGNYEKALELAGKAAQLDPKLAPAHNALAICSYMLGDMQSYEQHYRRAVSNGSNGERIKSYIASLDATI